jgi:hypothetical protein
VFHPSGSSRSQAEWLCYCRRRYRTNTDRQTEHTALLLEEVLRVGCKTEQKIRGGWMRRGGLGAGCTLCWLALTLTVGGSDEHANAISHPLELSGARPCMSGTMRRGAREVRR